jgi:RNA polymerase sigma-70 factor (ECF subfamily)
MPSRDPLADATPLIRRVYSFVAFQVGHGAAAEDITSDVFERAVRYRDSYDPAKGSPVTWLLGIARRSIAGAHFEAAHGEAELDETADGRDLEADTLRRLELSRALGRLDERERDLLALRYGAGLSSREIGRFLELEPNAVDVALHRARTRLKSDLTDDGPREPQSSSSRSSAPAQN